MNNIRIGSFSKKHGVTQNTVRHYIDMGLLASNKIGGQYGFSEKDSEDMEEIIKLKHLGFNLNEALKLLTFFRLSGSKTDEYKKMLLFMLKDKKEEVKKIYNKYEKMHLNISEAIEELEININNSANVLGIPIAYLGILVCPDCQSKLNIRNGIIDNSMLIEGDVICQCGYCAKVKYGVFIEEKTARKRMLRGKPWPSRDDYLQVVSPNFINFVYSGMVKVSDELIKYDKNSKLILELQHCVGYFLNHYMTYRSEDSTYILVDFDIEHIIQIKKSLEMNFEHMNFIFLCCDIDRMPLHKSTIDIIVDHWMTKDYAQTDKDFILKKALPFLKNDGLLVGSYPYFENMRNIKNISTDVLDYFNKEKLIEKIEGLGIKQLNIMDIGPVLEDNPYNYDISGREVYQMIYVGKYET